MNIERLKNTIDWAKFSTHHSITENVMRKFNKELDWHLISRTQTMSESFISEFRDKVNWRYISQYQILSEEFISEFRDKVNWDIVSQYQILSTEFIRDYNDLINWKNISKYQLLDDAFIREFKYDVNMNYIQQYQYLSKQFLTDFNLKRPKQNWNYMVNSFKLEVLYKHWLTGIDEDDDNWVYGYTNATYKFKSFHDNRLGYKPGNVVVMTNVDANCKNSDSFGLVIFDNIASALRDSKVGRLMKVRTKVGNIKALTHRNKKIRCNCLEILEEIV